ncbi:MAG: hypothetical protein ACKVWV_09045 [Planctomycetota bacterium]
MWTLIVLGLVPCVPLIWCTWRFVRRPRAPRFVGRLGQAVGLLALWTWVAVVAQLVYLVVKQSSLSVLDALATTTFSWWVLLGGASVQAVFEETAKDVTGHRQWTMIDNWHYYVALTAVQTLVLAAILAWRWKKPRKRFDPAVVAVVVLVVGNALAGITWPWWGT